MGIEVDFQAPEITAHSMQVTLAECANRFFAAVRGWNWGTQEDAPTLNCSVAYWEMEDDDFCTVKRIEASATRCVSPATIVQECELTLNYLAPRLREAFRNLTGEDMP